MEKQGVHFLLALACAFTLAAPGLFGQAKAPSQSFDLIDWNGGKFIYGVDYYPEQWEETQWEEDAAMMQAAGINLVRLAGGGWGQKGAAGGALAFFWGRPA